METEKSETKVEPKQKVPLFFEQPGENRCLSYDEGKILSFTVDAPEVGWATLCYTDERDEFKLNEQMFYVPLNLFFSIASRIVYA